MSRFPALDGLRAISILLVIVSHAVPLIVHGPWGHAASNLGEPGVNVFFVISGYLITRLLLRELDKRGTVSLWAFYRRRLLRITPAYVLFLGVAAALSATGLAIVDHRAWPYLLSYTYNLTPNLGVAFVGQVWSLCVEEHFYLLWPLTLLVAGPRRAVPILLATFVGAAVLRYVVGAHLDIDYFTFTRIDTISAGCLLALFERSHPALVGRIRGGWWVFAGAALFVVSFGLLDFVSGTYQMVLRPAVEGSAICVLLMGLTNDPGGWATRALDTPVPVFIGRLSYSLYLGQFALDKLQSWHLPLPARLGVMTAYALFSYYAVEQPFLRLKDRLEGRRQDARAASS